jgi:protein-disulfide isomerase
MMNERVSAALDRAAAIAMIVASALLVWNGLGRPGIGVSVASRAKPPVPSIPLSLEGAWTRGSSAAPLGILIYSDFACPYCRSLARDTLPSLLRNYVDTGRVKLAFRHLPLRSIHPDAVLIAEAVECAGIQGRFWEMHDQLFSIDGKLGPDALRLNAGVLRLDGPAFDLCMSETATRSRIESDVTSASLLHVGTTPTLLLGKMTADGRLAVMEIVSGAQPYSTLSGSLDRMARRVDTKRAAPWAR